MALRSSRVIGRENELGDLAHALDSAGSGRGGAIFLTGEGGIGKSRLAAETAARALAADMPVLRGRASSIGPMVPFRPLAEALLSHFRGGCPPPDPELGPFVPVLAQLVPDWRDGDRPHDNSSLVVLAEAVYRLLAVTGRERGCLVVLDDLQDADAETLFILEYLVDNLAASPVLLVGTLRGDPPGALGLVTAAVRRRSCVLLELDRLGPEDTRRLAAACLETEAGKLPDAAAELLWRNSAGIPFVIEELLHGMLNDGVLVAGKDGWRTSGELRARVPAALVNSVGSRVDQLGGDAETLLSVAAVLGHRFPLSVVQAVTGMDDRTLHNHLGAAVSAHLVTTDETSPGWYAFRHPLTTEALLARLVPATKARLARSAAEVLEEQFPGLPGELCALAGSLRLTAMDEPGAGALFTEAGRRALDAGAADSAVSLLSKALDLLTTAGAAARADVLETLLRALGQTGQFDRAVRLADRFAEVGTLDQVAHLHTQLAWAAYVAGRHDECLGQLERARAPLGSEMRDEQCAAIDAVEANLWLDVPGRDHTLRAERLAAQAWRIAERADAPFVACQALQVLGMITIERDTEEAFRYLRRARRVAEEHGLHHLGVQVLVRHGGQSMIADGDESILELAGTEAARTGAITLSCAVAVVRAIHAVMRTDFAGARELLEANQPVITRLRLTALRQYALMVRAVLAAHQADRAGMERALDDFRAAGGEDAQERVLSIGMGRVFCSLLEEDFARARDELRQVSALEERKPSRFHLAGQHGLRLLVEAVADTEPSEVDYESAAGGLRWNRQFARLAEAVRLGRLGRVEEANAAATLALEAAELYPVARHLALRLVAACAAADGWGEPVTWLKEAEEYFHTAGIPAVASACRGLLRGIGAPVRQRRTGIDRVPDDLRAAGITVREYEVLVLVADRLGNKDIAQRLHISPRTVEKHVASLMAKAQRADRAALVDYAAGLPGLR
ncbi:AAA family ATPase [Amycolatopsis sp. NPDC059021]|uniref:AAA family ATPase n=1 Tax=Amycolatopsis sp. NPDC059021 TaxID=3346704 RepID=UPI0036704D3A